jgi:hypothetical protein
MVRIDWNKPRIFEAGIDRGVLYVGDNPGVPWLGLIRVSRSSSGGESKPRYLDGVKISNHTSPEEFSGTIEAYSYPDEFEPCDGTHDLGYGLRAKQQQRKTFGLSYRTRVGDSIEGVDYAHKIHILYNLRAEPSEREDQTLSNEIEPIEFSWDVTSRGEQVLGLLPTAHFEVDSREIPPVLLQQLEDILYGTATTEPSLPSAGELIFLFDSFEDLVYDAGSPLTPVFSIHDAGPIDTPVTTTIDSGGV